MIYGRTEVAEKAPIIYNLVIQELVKYHGPPLVVLNNLPIYNACFLVQLVKLGVKKELEYSLPPKQEECNKEHITEYNIGNMETVILVIGLSCLS
jgi:hypothetical protein